MQNLMKFISKNPLCFSVFLAKFVKIINYKKYILKQLYKNKIYRIFWNFTIGIISYGSKMGCGWV